MTSLNTLQAGAWVLCFGRGFRCPVVSFRGMTFSVYPITFNPSGQIKLSKQKKTFKNWLMAARTEEMPMAQCYW